MLHATAIPALNFGAGADVAAMSAPMGLLLSSGKSQNHPMQTLRPKLECQHLHIATLYIAGRKAIEAELPTFSLTGRTACGSSDPAEF